MIEHDKCYFENEEVIERYDEYIDFLNSEEVQEVDCPDYNSKIRSILSGKTYEEQVLNYINHIKETKDSTEDDMIDIGLNDEILDETTSDEETTKKIMEEYASADFCENLMQACEICYENYLEEEEDYY